MQTSSVTSRICTRDFIEERTGRCQVGECTYRSRMADSARSRWNSSYCRRRALSTAGSTTQMLSRYFKESEGGRRAAAKPLNYDVACQIAGEHRDLPELLR